MDLQKQIKKVWQMLVEAETAEAMARLASLLIMLQKDYIEELKTNRKAA